MDVTLEPGKYVMAVSGGVDSVVLLNVLSKQKNLSLVVAHFDHGIREDSGLDRVFVQKLAKLYSLPFEYAEGKLGKNTSEAAARQARYTFLEEVKKKLAASAIVTAHHQDDLIETAIINMLRGTGRKGLTSLSSGKGLVRPLLGFSKKDLREYAETNGLEWREDSTNQDTKYLRNYVRRDIVAKLTRQQRQKLVELIEAQHSVNVQLDTLLLQQAGGRRLNHSWFINLPHEVAREAMAAWLRHNGLREFDKAAIERAVVGAKTSRPGKLVAVKKDVFIEIGKDKLALKHLER